MTKAAMAATPARRPQRSPERSYSVGPEADAAIAKLFEEFGGDTRDPLLHEIVVTALKLSDESPDRADLKLANAALKELRHALRVFAPYRDMRKVSIFGSARTPADHVWSTLARDYARRIVEAGWMVITGGASGVMGAGIEGAGRAAAFGALIRLPKEEAACPILDGDPKQIRFRYFFTRKLVFVRESHAICLLPGGFGTHDEAFEILTLVQTGKTAPRPIVMLEDPESGFWGEWLDFHRRHLVARGLVDRDDFDLLTLARTPQEAADATARFYRNYHSLRLVGERLVLRLRRPIPEDALGALAREHGGVLAGGGFEARAALPAERSEPELADLPRLVFQARFDRAPALHRLIAYLNTF